MINNLILLAADTLAVFASIAVGMRWHGAVLARRQPKPAPAPNLVCGCKHVLAYHDPTSGECYQTVEYGHYEKKKGGGNVWVTASARCSCRQYTGELTADWYARSIMRPESAEPRSLPGLEDSPGD